MHELSIARSIYDAVLQEMKVRNLPAVNKIAVRVGSLSGVLPDALQFSFEAIIPDTPLANCQFEIENLPVRGICQACGQAFEVTDFLFCCPSCQSGQIKVTHGYELDIAYLEVEDREDKPVGSTL